MGQRVQGSASNAAQQLEKARVAGEIRAHHQRIDEITNHVRLHGGITAGRWRSNSKRLLPSVAVEQCLESSQERRIERSAFVAREFLESARECWIQFEGVSSSAMRLQRDRKSVV